MSERNPGLSVLVPAAMTRLLVALGRLSPLARRWIMRRAWADLARKRMDSQQAEWEQAEIDQDELFAGREFDWMHRA